MDEGRYLAEIAKVIIPKERETETKAIIENTAKSFRERSDALLALAIEYYNANPQDRPNFATAERMTRWVEKEMNYAEKKLAEK